MSDESPLRTEDQGPVRVLTLNRPEHRNALSRKLVAALNTAIENAAGDSKIRIVVLAGAGTVFCAGIDLKEALADRSETGAAQDLLRLARLLNDLHRLSKPTIAAVAGDALAAGAALALACDFVIMADEARLGYPEVKRGLVPAIVMHDLVRQLGDRRARELLLSGETISATVAERWGLIHRVVPAADCLAKATELAQTLIGSAPGAGADQEAAR